MPFRFVSATVWAAGFVLLVANGLVVFGAIKGALTIPAAALLALFVSLTILFAVETVRSLEHGDGFAVDSHWGGLGGGLGGWQVSRPFMFLIAALACAGLTFAVASPHLNTATTPGSTAIASGTEDAGQTTADGAAKPGQAGETTKAEPPSDEGS
jgi:hypothetical protein